MKEMRTIGVEWACRVWGEAQTAAAPPARSFLLHLPWQFSPPSLFFISIFFLFLHFPINFVLAQKMTLLATSTVVALSLLVLALAVIRYFVVPVPSWFNVAPPPRA